MTNPAEPFENPYREQTDAVLDQYLSRGPFEYDLDSDPLWGQYQKTYLREGQRAREDTLANYAAATGGQSSTAAVNAASQAQDYYNAQMADRIPDLYQFAYNQWLNEGQQYAGQLDALRALGSDAMNEWGANVNLRNSQLAGLQSVSDDLYNRAYNKWQSDYAVDRDSVGDTRYEDELGYSRSQERKQQALSQALEWLRMGVAPDAAVAEAAGLTEREVEEYLGAVRSYAEGGSGGSGGSGSSSGSRRSSGGENFDGGDIWQQLYDSGVQDEDFAYSVLRQKGYGVTDAERYAKYYAELYYPEMARKNRSNIYKENWESRGRPVTGSK